MRGWGKFASILSLSLSLSVRPSVFLLSIYAHAQRSPREKQSLDSHKNTTRLRGEIFGEKSSEHAGNILFFLFIIPSHFVRYLVEEIERRLEEDTLFSFLTDGWYEFFDSIAID